MKVFVDNREVTKIANDTTVEVEVDSNSEIYTKFYNIKSNTIKGSVENATLEFKVTKGYKMVMYYSIIVGSITGGIAGISIVDSGFENSTFQIYAIFAAIFSSYVVDKIVNKGKGRQVIITEK